MPFILITGKDWTSRALLRAQLIEEGLEVEAYEDVQTVVDRLWGCADMPPLLIVDLFGSEHLMEDVETLSPWAKLVPIWVLAGQGTGEADALEGRGFERVLFRPVDVGKLVQEISDRLAG